jgi:hypothetical protein
VRFLRKNLAGGDFQVAAHVLSATSELETLDDASARAAFVANIGNVRATKPHLTRHTVTVFVPQCGGRSSKRGPMKTLACGTRAQCCFAYELHQALLSVAHQQLAKSNETKLATLRRGMKDMADIAAILQKFGIHNSAYDTSDMRRCFRIQKPKGVVIGASPDISHEAAVIASCSVAQKLVFVHMERMNTSLRRQLAAIPSRHSDVNAVVVRACEEHRRDAAKHYYLFRRAVVDFCRARHILQCEKTGQVITREFIEEDGDDYEDDDEDDAEEEGDK